jgi:hypothetical protein
MKTSCPHLSESYILSCKANLRVYVPSIQELGEYCHSTNHSVCQFYCSGESIARSMHYSAVSLPPQ